MHSPNKPAPAAQGPRFRLRALHIPLVVLFGALVVLFGLPMLVNEEGTSQMFLISLLLISGLVLGLVEIRRLNRRLANLARTANALGQGDYDTRAEVRGDDSVSLVSEALNTMAQRVASTVSQLALSQEKMAEQNRELTQAYTRQSRFGDFLAKLNSINIDSLARDAFPDLVAVARAHIGVFYLFDEEQQQLNRLTEHGIDRSALRQLCPDKSFEGLPGEAFSRREWITIDEIDQDLLPEINLGFASAKIQSVYAIPILFQNKALGVVVLASLHKTDAAVAQSLENYIRALGHALNNALTHQAVQQQTVQFESSNSRLVNLDNHRRQFVANMSHELRTPLNSIIGFSNILLKNRDGLISTDNLDRVEKINRNGVHLLQLINDILDLSKVEAGRMETERVETDIAPILREVAEMLHPLANAKSIKIELELPPEPVICPTDAQKVRQIVINLANNAVKFTDEGSVTIRLYPPGEKYLGVCIEVQDTGIGISEDKLEAVFDAFQQADSTTSRKYGGTGLGLTISRTLLTLLGGRIRVSSKVNRGSTFSIELPVTDPTSGNSQHSDLLFDEFAPMA